MFDKNKHQRNWSNRRIAEAKQVLGGCCVVCGIVENLQFDHIDPDTKSFEITTAGSFSKEQFWAEVGKCQLLCVPHHLEKSSKEHSLRIRGSLNPNNKLREIDIKYIRKLSELGHGPRSIAREFGVSHPTICEILNEKIWSWLP